MNESKGDCPNVLAWSGFEQAEFHFHSSCGLSHPWLASKPHPSGGILLKQVRRWRLLNCFMGQDREQRAKDAIRCYEQEGYKAKVWAPLPQHKTSGHVHVVVLCTLAEKVMLGLGIRRKYGTRPCPDIPYLLAELKKVRERG